MWLSCVLGSCRGSCGCGGGVTVAAPVPLFSLALRPPVEVGGRSSRRRLPAFPRAARKAPSCGGFLLLLLLQLAVDFGGSADEIEAESTRRRCLVLDGRRRKDAGKKRHFGGALRKKMEPLTVPAP